MNNNQTVYQKFKHIFNNIGKLRKSYSMIVIFTILSILQAILCIVAWGTSSGYEDSSVNYAVQALLGLAILFIISVLVIRSVIYGSIEHNEVSTEYVEKKNIDLNLQ